MRRGEFFGNFRAVGDRRVGASRLRWTPGPVGNVRHAQCLDFRKIDAEVLREQRAERPAVRNLGCARGPLMEVRDTAVHDVHAPVRRDRACHDPVSERRGRIGGGEVMPPAQGAIPPPAAVIATLPLPLGEGRGSRAHFTRRGDLDRPSLLLSLPCQPPPHPRQVAVLGLSATMRKPCDRCSTAAAPAHIRRAAFSGGPASKRASDQQVAAARSAMAPTAGMPVGCLRSPAVRAGKAVPVASSSRGSASGGAASQAQREKSGADQKRTAGAVNQPLYARSGDGRLSGACRGGIKRRACGRENQKGHLECDHLR